MIYDPQGRPIPEDAGGRDAPQAGQHVFFDASDRSALDVSRGLTPEKIDRIMTAANSGDTEQQCSLSIEVEEKDWDIGQALQTRRAALAGLPWTIEPPEGLTDNAAAKKVAAALKAALDNAGTGTLLSFPDLIKRSLLLSLVPGVAAAEVVLENGGETIVGFQHLPASSLSFRDGIRRPKLITRDTPLGIDLNPGKFIVHTTPGASGDPARGGLIRPLAWLFCFTNLNFKDLLTFIERYGMPFLLARVDASSYDTERSRLSALVRNFGSAGGGVFTKAVEAQLLQGQLGAADVYFKLLEYVGDAKQKVIQGQTATSGEGNGWSKGSAQAAVRQDIMEGDCADLAPTLRRELFSPWTMWNFGPKAPVPRIVFQTAPPADATAFATMLNTMAQAGFEPEDDGEVSAKIGMKMRRKAVPVRDPNAGGGFPPPPAPPTEGQRPRSQKDSAALAAESLGNVPVAPSREGSGEPGSAGSSDLSERLAAELGVPAGWLDPVASLLQDLEAKANDAAITDEELLAFAESAAAKLPELFAGMNIDGLAEMFEKAMGAAAIEGAKAGMQRTAV